MNHLGCSWEAKSSDPLGDITPAAGGLPVLTAGYCPVSPHALVDSVSCQGFEGTPKENTSKRYNLGLFL